MENEIHIEDYGDYLRVEIAGMYHLEKVITAIDLLDMEYHRKPYSKVLLDIRSLKGEVGIIDRVKIGSRAIQFNYRNARVAILSEHEQRGAARFMIAYLNYRGTRVRLADHIAEAKTWLLN